MSEFMSFLSMEKKLEEKYPHKIISICNGALVAIGDSYREVIDKSYEKIGKKKIFVHRLGPLKKLVAIL